MRIVLDTNLWSSLDDGSLPNFDALLSSLDVQVQVMPSTLLEVVEIPHEHVRKAIVHGLARGPRRVRMRTEADMFAEELINLVRRTRPEWLLQVPNPALAARHRNFWLKQIWRNALDDSTAMHAYQVAQRPVKDVVLKRQKYHRSEIQRTQFELGDLTELIGEHQDLAPGLDPLFGNLPGWDGSPRAAWRLNLAQLMWYELGVVGPRARLTGEDRTATDWVEPWIDLRRLRADPERFVSMWLEDATIEEVPRNWLNWALDAVQWTMKIGPGNPADAQHASYLVDCDVFLTADARFAQALERVRKDAPFDFATAVVVSGDRSVATADRVERALVDYGLSH